MSELNEKKVDRVQRKDDGDGVAEVEAVSNGTTESKPSGIKDDSGVDDDEMASKDVSRRKDLVGANQMKGTASGDKDSPSAVKSPAAAIVVGAGGDDHEPNHIAQIYDPSPDVPPPGGARAGQLAIGIALFEHDEQSVREEDVDVENAVVAEDVSGLAVAVEIPEDERGQSNVPQAEGVEYDPSAKPSIIKNPRFFLYVAIACLALTGIVVGVTLGVHLANSNSAPSPAPPVPPPYRETLGIRDRVVQVVGAAPLEDPRNPYTQALQWITYMDPAQLLPEDSHFIQRYLAAYFYFATTVKQPWASCSAPDSANDTSTDCTFLVATTVDPLQYQGIPWVRWLTNTSECEWAGVTCDAEEQIREMDLLGSNMTGSFPEGVKYLPFLQYLSIGIGDLSGTVPTEILSLKHLVYVELTGNSFTGTISPAWWHSRSLQQLRVGNNQLVGTIPSDVGQWKDCKQLEIMGNAFDGPIPTEVGNLKSANYLWFQNNRLNGTIPTELGSIYASLVSIRLSNNFLEGTIPTEVASLPLVLFDLQSNPVEGSIPVELWQEAINSLDLSHCNLTGTLSPAVELSQKLTFLYLNNNHLSGMIPSELGSITQLDFVTLEGNDFTGTMPSTMCDLRGPALLRGLRADCTVDQSTGQAQVTCPVGCCTDCCQSDGSNCQSVVV